MLFKVSWRMFSDKKLECYRVFSTMTEDDDKKDCGDQISIVGRWHNVGNGTGVCICETDSVEDLTSWMVNWAGMCDIDIVPVVDDRTCRRVLKRKLSATEDRVEEAVEDRVEDTSCTAADWGENSEKVRKVDGKWVEAKDDVPKVEEVDEMGKLDEEVNDEVCVPISTGWQSMEAPDLNEVPLSSSVPVGEEKVYEPLVETPPSPPQLPSILPLSQPQLSPLETTPPPLSPPPPVHTTPPPATNNNKYYWWD